MEQIISIEEARKILGKPAVGMSDEEISNVIQTLGLLAKEALGLAERDREEEINNG